MDKCSYANKYQAKREPTCGCEVCGLKWQIAQLQAERDELKQRGRAMSNVLFNLKQRAGYTLTDSDRETMEKLQEAWDRAFLGATDSEGAGNG